MTEPREDDRPDPTHQAETAAEAARGARHECERESEATIRSISRLEESN